VCGIFGWITPGNPLPLAHCAQGLAELKHRGPDGNGVLLARLAEGWTTAIYNSPPAAVPLHAGEQPDVFLGHHRLAIIDLDVAASQPLTNENQTVWVVFNGEIYNHAELRQELLGRGHRFRTDHSDTEVLVHGYEEWGDRLVERLRGMFAFAILSLPERRLYMARDRFGEKPLYFSASQSSVWFSSELKAPLAAGAIRRELSETGLAHFLAFGFIPAPVTIFNNVLKLAAAEHVTIDLDNPAACRPSTYWRLQPPQTSLTAEQAEQHFFDELSTSIRLRMESDVPLGAFLSGGMDSSVVVREMSKTSQQPVNTFTIGFREQSSDESQFAGHVAQRYHTRHRVETLDAAAMLRIVPLLERHFDEPFSDSSAIPTYLVAKMARENVAVALSGDGGDELLCGYTYYRVLHNFGRLLNRMPDWLVRFGAAPLHNFWPEWLRGRGRVQYLLPGDFARFTRYWIDEYLLRQASLDGAAPNAFLRQRWEQAGRRGVEAMGEVDCQLYVPENLMVKVDRATMAVSLESRAPLLDHRLFEAAFALPFSARFDGRRGKLPFRHLLTQDLGVEAVERPKQGFGIPLGTWFRGPLQEYLREAILDTNGLILQLFPRSAIENLIRLHLTGSRDQSARLWRLLMLGRWFECYGRQPAPISSPALTNVVAS
jgi:asparagine synthase (glutamine-hydrolysing)